MGADHNTPGPWEVVQSATTCPTDWAVVAGSKLKFVGDIEHEADARLIAAAPDLLVALKNIMEYLGEGDQDIVQSAWWVNDKKAARIAIAKAKGKA